MHAHHYLQFGFSSTQTIELASPCWRNFRKVRSFLIPSDIKHQIRLRGKDQVLMIWLDPEFQASQSVLVSDTIQIQPKELETSLTQLCERRLNCELARKIRNIVIRHQMTRSSTELDERISSTIDWIGTHLSEQTITTEQLAGLIYLSPSRFMHLFSEQIGIPVRKYILWQRLRYSLLLMAEDSTLTKAAHGAGFTDSSHMNRTFNTMFGITPSKIFKNSRFIQVISC